MASLAPMSDESRDRPFWTSLQMTAQNNLHVDSPEVREKIRKIVWEILRGDQRPNSVDATGVTFFFGEDAGGDLGVWIYLLIDEDARPSKEKIKELNEFAKLILDTIIDENLDFWPYIQYVEKSTEP